MISQPVSSISPCSPLPSGTWRTPYSRPIYIIATCWRTLVLCGLVPLKLHAGFPFLTPHREDWSRKQERVLPQPTPSNGQSAEAGTSIILYKKETILFPRHRCFRWAMLLMRKLAAQRERTRAQRGISCARSQVYTSIQPAAGCVSAPLWAQEGGLSRCFVHSPQGSGISERGRDHFLSFLKIFFFTCRETVKCVWNTSLYQTHPFNFASLVWRAISVLPL